MFTIIPFKFFKIPPIIPSQIIMLLNNTHKYSYIDN